MQQEALESKPSLLRQVREALTGNEVDFTTISLNRAILLLAIPMVIEMSMESLFAIIDIYFVAKLGAYAAATVQLTEGLLVFVYALGFGLAMGTTAVVARRVGEKDMEGASLTAFQAVVIAAVIGLVLMLVGVPFSSQLLAFMGADPEVLDKGTWFTRISLASSASIMLLFLMNAIFRGAGDAAIAMRVLILANGINILLGPALINGWGPLPEMGVTGSAIGTLVGRSVGVAYQFWLLFGKGHRIAIARRHMHVAWTEMAKILSLSGTAILQFVIQTASWTFMIKLASQFGAAANAGYGIAVRIVIFTLMPSWGLGGAAATLVGQNLGAKQPDRAEQAVWRAGLFNAIFLLAVSVVYIGLPHELMRIFIQEARVVEIGASALRIFAYTYVVFAYGMVIVQALNGSGDTRTPMFINLFCYWMLQIPLAWFLANKTVLAVDGIFWAVAITECLVTAIGVLVFRSGRWKSIKV